MKLLHQVAVPRAPICNAARANSTKPFILGVLAATFLGVTPEALRAQDDLSGQWVGAYHTFPNVVRMSLTLGEDEGGVFRGEMRIEGLVDDNGIFRAPVGVVPVEVRYDPLGQIVEIVPDANVAARAGFQLPQLRGVFDASLPAMAGRSLQPPSQGSPYFVLARPDDVDDLLFDELKDAANDARNQGGLNFGGLANRFRGGPGRDKIMGWAARFVEEYPDVDAMRTQIGAVMIPGRNLYRNEHFEEHFGKRYEEMGGGERGRVGREIQNLDTPRSNLPEDRVVGVLKAVGGGFSNAGAPDITLSAVAFQIMQNWRDLAIRGLRELEPKPGAMQQINSVESAEQAILVDFWPSERAAFSSDIQRVRSDLAAPLLIALVAESIATAQDISGAQRLAASLQGVVPASPGAALPGVGGRGQPGAAPNQGGGVGAPPVGSSRRGNRRGARPGAAFPGGALPGTQPGASTGETIPELMLLVSQDIRSAQRELMQQTIEQLVQQEVQQDRQAMVVLGVGIGGLQAGVVWYSGVAQKYGSLSSEQPVVELLQQFSLLRSGILQGVEPTLASQIAAATSVRQIDQIVSSHLAVPSDRADPAGARLLRAGQQQQGQLATVEQANRAREEEAARLAASACAQAPDEGGRSGGEPTARDMCRALEALLTGAQDNLSGLADSCANVRQSDPGAALLCLAGQAANVGGGPQLSIRSFRKIACVAAVNRPGFVCDYMAGIQSNNPLTRSMFEAFPNEITTRRFVESGGEWLLIN